MFFSPIAAMVVVAIPGGEICLPFPHAAAARDYIAREKLTKQFAMRRGGGVGVNIGRREKDLSCAKRTLLCKGGESGQYFFSFFREIFPPVVSSGKFGGRREKMYVTGLIVRDGATGGKRCFWQTEGTVAGK